MIRYKEALKFLLNEGFGDDTILMGNSEIYVSDLPGGPYIDNSVAKATPLTFLGGVPFKKIEGTLEDLYWDRKLYRYHQELFSSEYENLMIEWDLNFSNFFAVRKRNLVITPVYIPLSDKFIFYVHKNRWGRSGMWEEWETVEKYLENCKEIKPLDLSKIRPGVILRHKSSGESYTTIYQNGKYPTVVRTIEVMNPSEWEVVKD